MNLSAYLSFSVTLDNNTGATLITDTSSYPSGVNAGITGIVSITQPDGLTYTGSWGTPDITWNGSQLTIASLELRMALDGLFQNGNYSITYTVRHASYDETSLTRTFSLSYARPTHVITEGFDIFTPLLKAIDSSVYTQTGFALQSVTRSWSTLIQSVSGTNQTKIGAGQEFDLSYGGSYYDSIYDITLQSIVNYKLSSYLWVTVIDKFSTTLTDDTALVAMIPPTLAELLADIKAFKSELDALKDTCDEYTIKEKRYQLITAIYDQLIKNGQVGELTGLRDYITELLFELNDGATPAYINTNGIIPAYDWGAAVGSTDWASITGKPSSSEIYFKAGDSGFTAVGGNTLTNALFANKRLVVFRNRLLTPSEDRGLGDYYEKPLISSTVTFFPALTTDEQIAIFILGI